MPTATEGFARIMLIFVFAGCSFQACDDATRLFYAPDTCRSKTDVNADNFIGAIEDVGRADVDGHLLRWASSSASS